VHQAQHQAAADLLLNAYASRTPVPPLIETYPELDLADAYRIQALQIDTWEQNGRTVVGRKIGLTSPAMQRQMRVTQPDHGVLRDDMVLADRAAVPVGAFIAPRVEPEIALVLGRDLSGPGCTVAAAAAAVDHVLPSLEIIDSRIADWRISIGDTIADNASSGAAVLGDAPVRLGDRDLRLVGCNLYRDGALIATGAGGAVFGNPLRSLAWLANTLAEFGVTLRAGQVVLPGSVTAAQPVSAGQTWTAAFAGIGTVTARFVEGGEA
jgi:2-keto-4-pentenoate hydratase